MIVQCLNLGNPAIFDFSKPVLFPANKPSLSSLASTFNFNFDKSGISPSASASNCTSIFEFKKPDIFDFKQPNIFKFKKPISPTSSSSLASGSNPPHSIFDFQVPGSTHLNYLPAMNPASPPALAQHPSASPLLLPSWHAGWVPIVPTAKDAVVAFVPALILVQTLDRSTPCPPCPTELLDLDPNSPCARGLHHHHNLAVWWEDGQLDPKIGNLLWSYT